MFAHNRFWILEERGYLPERAPGRTPPEGVLVDGAPLPAERAQAGHGPGVKTGAGGKPQGYDSIGRYTGPRGGSVSLRDGSIRLYADGPEETDGADKQAGADSETGRREPRSLLSATAEQLDTIASGTGQAVAKGAAGAKQALGRTWEELSTNQELHKGVEFGVKAAGEVSKDVWKQVGKDAGSAAFGHFRPGAGEGAGRLFGTTGGLIWKGADSYDKLPKDVHELGDRITRVRDAVYGKKQEP